MEVKLSKYIVKLKDELTWGNAQKIQSAIMSGAKMSGKDSGNIGFDFDASTLLESKYVALECSIIEIKEGENVITFTREWMDNLSISDGNKLTEAVDEISKKK